MDFAPGALWMEWFQRLKEAIMKTIVMLLTLCVGLFILPVPSFGAWKSHETRDDFDGTTHYVARSEAVSLGMSDWLYAGDTARLIVRCETSGAGLFRSLNLFISYSGKVVGGDYLQLKVDDGRIESHRMYESKSGEALFFGVNAVPRLVTLMLTADRLTVRQTFHRSSTATFGFSLAGVTAALASFPKSCLEKVNAAAKVREAERKRREAERQEEQSFIDEVEQAPYVRVARDRNVTRRSSREDRKTEVLRQCGKAMKATYDLGAGRKPCVEVSYTPQYKASHLKRKRR